MYAIRRIKKFWPYEWCYIGADNNEFMECKYIHVHVHTYICTYNFFFFFGKDKRQIEKKKEKKTL